MSRIAGLIGLALSAASVLAFQGCSAAHNVVIKGDGSGTMTMHLEVSKLLHDYIAGLAEVSGAQQSSPGAIFDLDAIRRGFEAQPGITVQDVSTSNTRTLDVTLAFAPLSDVFSARPGLKSANVVTFTVAEGLATLRFHLDRSNYRQVAAFFPMLASPVLQSLGPQVDQPVSQDDYLSMVRFSLGDQAPGLVKTSSITVTVRPEGDIVSQTGGSISGGQAVFQIPLLRALLLDAPLDFSLTFRPAE